MMRNMLYTTGAINSVAGTTESDEAKTFRENMMKWRERIKKVKEDENFESEVVESVSVNSQTTRAQKLRWPLSAQCLLINLNI